MRNFQGIVFKWTQTYTEIFKSALVYLCRIMNKMVKCDSLLVLYSEPKFVLRNVLSRFNSPKPKQKSKIQHRICSSRHYIFLNSLFHYKIIKTWFVKWGTILSIFNCKAYLLSRGCTSDSPKNSSNLNILLNFRLKLKNIILSSFQSFSCCSIW